MTPKYVLSIDVGSTSTRTVLFDENAKAVCRCQKPFGGASPEPGHVEYDAEELFQVTLETLQNCVKQSGVALDRIDSVGIAVQRGTFVTWDKRTGKPAQKFISWQDTRATADCESWNESMRLKFVKKFNALWNVVFGDEHSKAIKSFHLSPAHASIRFHHALQNIPAVRRLAQEGHLAFGTIDTWLVYRLTCGRVHATDVSCASSTGMFDPFDMKYGAITGLLSIPHDALPEVRPTNGGFGSIDARWLGAEIPIKAVVGDQQSACFAERCKNVGDSKLTLGTGIMLDVVTGSAPLAPFDGFVPLIGWQLRTPALQQSKAAATTTTTTYIIEGAEYAGGAFIDACVRWGIVPSARSSAGVALQVPDSAGVKAVPSLNGLAAPYQNPRARGALLGLTLACDYRHITRAILESVAFRSFELYRDATRHVGNKLKKNRASNDDDDDDDDDDSTSIDADLRPLRIDGGVSRNALIIQTIVELGCKDVIVAEDADDTTARGAAFFAGLGSVWKDLETLDKIDAAMKHIDVVPFDQRKHEQDDKPSTASASTSSSQQQADDANDDDDVDENAGDDDIDNDNDSSDSDKKHKTKKKQKKQKTQKHDADVSLPLSMRYAAQFDGERLAHEYAAWRHAVPRACDWATSSASPPPPTTSKTTKTTSHR